MWLIAIYVGGLVLYSPRTDGIRNVAHVAATLRGRISSGSRTGVADVSEMARAGQVGGESGLSWR